MIAPRAQPFTRQRIPRLTLNNSVTMTQATSTAAATAHPAEFAERRLRLAQQLGPGVAVIPTAPERMRNRDSDYLYRFDSYFWYLTGFAEPQAVLVLIVAGDGKIGRAHV